nr:NAD(P)H-binding protein [Loigolactobacillus backii]
MKIFVTGGTGKVGSRLIPYLIKHGHQIKALVRNPQKAEKLANSGAELVVGDLLKDELTNQLGGCDAVIHVAAQFRGNVSDEQQNDINFKATLNLANSAILAGVKRFVFASTSNV